jgi:hypothetical protein
MAAYFEIEGEMRDRDDLDIVKTFESPLPAGVLSR